MLTDNVIFNVVFDIQLKKNNQFIPNGIVYQAQFIDIIGAPDR